MVWSLVFLVLGCAQASGNVIAVSTPENDILAALPTSLGVTTVENITAGLAMAQAGDVLMVLAPSFPNTTRVSAEQFTRMSQLKLRVYIEFPASLPSGSVQPSVSPLTSGWNRVVVQAHVPNLPDLALLSTHKGTPFVNVTGLSANMSMLVYAKVAGFDTAVYGLPTISFPLLFELPGSSMLIASTQLSNCVRMRFAPMSRWGAVWTAIVAWLLPEAKLQVRLQPLVSPMYSATAQLPADAQRSAMVRGVQWYERSGLLANPSMLAYVAHYWDDVCGGKQCSLPAPPQSIRQPSGQGQLGILEGYSSDTVLDGSQPLSGMIRDDCVCETSLPFALRSLLSPNSSKADARVATNLLNYAWVHGGFPQPWNPPTGSNNASAGLLAWFGTGPGAGEFYKDDDARALLAAIGTSGALGTDKWVTTIATAILANLRITGVEGFGPPSAHFADINQNGWPSYFRTNYSTQGGVYSPHYQSYIWAVYLWGYQRSGYEPLFDRAYRAIRTMMTSYPAKWIPTANGITCQRARILLPLAWLARVLPGNTTVLSWIATAVDGIMTRQDVAGSFQEEVSAVGWGGSTRVPNNADYGTFEAPLNQENTDPVSDMLYTNNFAFLGLHELLFALRAHPQPAIGSNTTAIVQKAEDRLADFFIRIQATSTPPSAHPELEGAYFRAFDYSKWEVWASDADIGWGAWSIETGWTQSWITAVLGMRELGTSLWDLGQKVDIKEELETYIPYYFPSTADAPH